MITYNHEAFIARALESVLTQRTNFDFEIVIGEDCSTDRTRDVLLDFHRHYPGRIVPLLRAHNLGVMKNLQETLTECRGQYVALIEGDDYWTSDEKLQRQVDFLDAHPECSLCCHRVQVLDEIGSGQPLVFPSKAAGSYSIEHLLEQNFIMTCTVVCRWNYVGSLPDWFLDLKLADWPLFALLATYGEIELMEDVMAAYRVHVGNTWSSKPVVYRARESVLMLKVLDKHLSHRYRHRIRRTLARLYLELASHAQKDCNRSETAKQLFNCIRYSGFQTPGSQRVVAALLAFSLFGSWYNSLARAKRAILG
jgi:glycosyltransferase involved in cell wall biosynthesis